MSKFKGLMWELSLVQNPKNIFFVMFWQLLVLPYRLERLVLRFLVGKEKRNKKYYRSFHAYIYRICKAFHIPLIIAQKIESLRFQDPYSHEAEVSKFISKIKGNIFVDVGANLGRYSILLSRNFKEIIAIEPHPENILCLRRNLSISEIENVKVIPYAVSDKNGYVNLYLAPHMGGHTIIHSYEKSIQVETKTLSSILKKSGCIDLVKVDVEGAEWQVLKGAENIMDDIRRWIIELHDEKRKSELEKKMEKYGYKTTWIDHNHLYAERSEEP